MCIVAEKFRLSSLPHVDYEICYWFISYMAVMSEIIWNIIILFTVLNLQSCLDHTVSMNFTVVISHFLIHILWWTKNLTPTNVLLYVLFVQSFTWSLHVSMLLSCHLQGADTKGSVKLTAIKWVAISVHMLWYPKRRMLQVLVTIVYITII